jgi:hypothetical protein
MYGIHIKSEAVGTDDLNSFAALRDCQSVIQVNRSQVG